YSSPNNLICMELLIYLSRSNMPYLLCRYNCRSLFLCKFLLETCQETINLLNSGNLRVDCNLFVLKCDCKSGSALADHSKSDLLSVFLRVHRPDQYCLQSFSVASEHYL